MNLKCRMIMDEYRESKNDFLQLGDIVSSLLKSEVKALGVKTLAVEHRVKAESSLAGKLELKGEKYSSLSDITDILGARIICFFSDDADKIAKCVEQMFVIDRENSIDERAVTEPHTFGYLSIHYICSLPDNGEYPPNVLNKKFEVQIRTNLQHTWAVIDHDLGYKNDFGVPRSVVRGFSRISGLLELADEQFVKLRDDTYSYSNDVKMKIANDEAGSVLIDSISLNEYVDHNKSMLALLGDLSEMCRAEIRRVNSESYIEQLMFLNIRTLGDLQEMLSEDRALAFALAKRTLEKTDLDILASNVGLRFLCRAELINKNYSADKVFEFMKIAVGDEKRALRQANRLLEAAEEVEKQECND